MTRDPEIDCGAPDCAEAMCLERRKPRLWLPRLPVLWGIDLWGVAWGACAGLSSHLNSLRPEKLRETVKNAPN
jgi:hypothetical protein